MMPMIKIGKDIKDIKIWEKDVFKVCKGEKLIWEKTKFNGFEITTFGSVNFNGNYKDKLPLNVPLKLTIRNDIKNYSLKINYVIKQKDLGWKSIVFMLKTEKVFTIATDGMLDIEIKQTSEQPFFVFE